MNHPLPSSPRIQVLGSSCSGKSTFARRLSLLLNIPHIELDALNWEANWNEASIDEFRARVAKAISGDSWVVDGSYSRKIGSILDDRLNCIVWLDVGLPRILLRFFKRSIQRSWSKELLWGGCQETLRNSIFKKDSLLFWILDNYHPARTKCLTLYENPPSGVRVVRLSSLDEIDAFLTSLDS